MRHPSSIPLLFLVALAVPAAGVAQTPVARFEMSPPAVAGPPGGVAFPDLEVRFVGDGRVIDGQADFAFDPARLTVVPTSLGGALCVVGSGPFAGVLRVIAPIRATPFPTTPTVFCRLRIEPRAGAPTALVAFEPVAGGVECNDAGVMPVPCQATGATVSVGPAPGTASVAYTPPAGTSISLPGTGTFTIGASFVPGGAGDAITIDDCATSGDPVFAPVVRVPDPLVFAGSAAASGAIRLGCLSPPSPGGVGTLTCQQRRNGGAPVAVTWPLVCPNTFVPPSVGYAPAVGVEVRVGGLDVIGHPNRTVVAVTIGTDGIGTGPAATSRVDDCTASAGFSAELPGGAVAATGTTGAAATLAVGCVPAATQAPGTLSCRETRATTQRTVTWPLVCPAGRSEALLDDGFE
jgi:hypothetical protein